MARTKSFLTKMVQNKILISLKSYIQNWLRKDILPGVFVGLLLSLGLAWPMISSGLHFHPLLVFIYQVSTVFTELLPQTYCSCSVHIRLFFMKHFVATNYSYRSFC